MFNNEQDFEEWRVDCLNKAKEILTMDKEKENNRSKKIETTGVNFKYCVNLHYGVE